MIKHFDHLFSPLSVYTSWPSLRISYHLWSTPRSLASSWHLTCAIPKPCFAVLPLWPICTSSSIRTKLTTFHPSHTSSFSGTVWSNLVYGAMKWSIFTFKLVSNCTDSGTADLGYIPTPLTSLSPSSSKPFSSSHAFTTATTSYFLPLLLVSC